MSESEAAVADAEGLEAIVDGDSASGGNEKKVDASADAKFENSEYETRFNSRESSGRAQKPGRKDEANRKQDAKSRQYTAKQTEYGEFSRDLRVIVGDESQRAFYANNEKSRFLADDKYGEEGRSKTLVERLAGDRSSADIESTIPHGALVIIWNEDPVTKQVEFYLERKPPSYPHGQENRLSVVGGNIDPPEKPERTVRRELGEEISSKAAVSIINRRMDSMPRFVMIEYVDGVAIKNYVYESKIPTREEWEAVKAASMTVDAGYREIKSIDEVVESKGQWAWNHYEIMMKFIRDFLRYKVSWSKPDNIKFKEPYTLFKNLGLPGVYPDSIHKPNGLILSNISPNYNLVANYSPDSNPKISKPLYHPIFS